MIVQEIELRTRYAETDQMGVIYYGTYATYYEVARVEAFRKMGISYKNMENEHRVMMPVIENTSRYLRSVHYDELLRIRVIIPKLPTVKMLYKYEFYNEANELVHTGETLLCFMNMDTRRPCRPPKSILDIIVPYFDKK
jgi:acyl-CoA thioester hydrolase